MGPSLSDRSIRNIPVALRALEGIDFDSGTFPLALGAFGPYGIVFPQIQTAFEFFVALSAPGL